MVHIILHLGLHFLSATCWASLSFVALQVSTRLGRCSMWIIGKQTKHIITALQLKESKKKYMTKDTQRSLQARLNGAAEHSLPVPTTTQHGRINNFWRAVITHLSAICNNTCPRLVHPLHHSALWRSHSAFRLLYTLRGCLHRHVAPNIARQTDTVVRGVKGGRGDNFWVAVIWTCVVCSNDLTAD